MFKIPLLFKCMNNDDSNAFFGQITWYFGLNFYKCVDFGKNKLNENYLFSFG